MKSRKERIQEDFAFFLEDNKVPVGLAVSRPKSKPPRRSDFFTRSTEAARMSFTDFAKKVVSVQHLTTSAIERREAFIAGRRCAKASNSYLAELARKCSL